MIRTKKGCKKNKSLEKNDLVSFTVTRNRLPRPGAHPPVMHSPESSFLVPHGFNVKAKTDADVSTSLGCSLKF